MNTLFKPVDVAVTCTIKFEVCVMAKPSVFRAYKNMMIPKFNSFTGAFNLQYPEFRYQIGDYDEDCLDHLPDEVGELCFCIIVESQGVICEKGARLMSKSASDFLTFWQLCGYGKTKSLLVQADGIPIVLD